MEREERRKKVTEEENDEKGRPESMEWERKAGRKAGKKREEVTEGEEGEGF